MHTQANLNVFRLSQSSATSFLFFHHQMSRLSSRQVLTLLHLCFGLLSILNSSLAGMFSSSLAEAVLSAMPQVVQRGYAVCENAISTNDAACIAREIRGAGPQLLSLERSRVNEKQIVKRGVQRINLQATCYGALPQAKALLDTVLTDDFMKALGESANAGIIEPEVSALCYDSSSGASFPMHVDAQYKAVAGRFVSDQLVSMLLFTEEPKEGGEFVLFPFPFAPVKLEPKPGRLVVFSSRHMYHRVLPITTGKRSALQVVYSGIPCDSRLEKLPNEQPFNGGSIFTISGTQCTVDDISGAWKMLMDPLQCFRMATMFYAEQQLTSKREAYDFTSESDKAGVLGELQRHIFQEVMYIQMVNEDTDSAYFKIKNRLPLKTGALRTT